MEIKFTDDDLKRLKDLIQLNNEPEVVDFWKIKEVLARLEAAERKANIYAEALGDMKDLHSTTKGVAEWLIACREADKAWRKAAGK